MISYEVSIGLILINIVLCTGSLNLTEIVLFQEEIWFIVPFFPLCILFLISGLAETNRPPFDLPEAEGELVAGYNVEYSSISFALFFIGEYANIILFSTLTVILFLGGWTDSGLSSMLFNISGYDEFLQDDLLNLLGSFLFLVKLNLILFIFIWVRASFPRYRYDQLMRLGWKVFLPVSLASVILTAGILYSFEALPLLF
jgi:NADH-quinone oxidoreductase subunit H